jgi:hypothetical protein
MLVPPAFVEYPELKHQPVAAEHDTLMSGLTTIPLGRPYAVLIVHAVPFQLSKRLDWMVPAEL